MLLLLDLCNAQKGNVAISHLDPEHPLVEEAPKADLRRLIRASNRTVRKMPMPTLLDK